MDYKKAGVDIDDPVGKGLHHLGRNPHQKSGQHDQIRREGFYFLRKGAVKSLSVAVLSRRNHFCLYSVCFCAFQRSRVPIVADYGQHPGVGNGPPVNGVQNGLQIGTPAGHAHYDSQHMSTPFSPAAQYPTT